MSVRTRAMRAACPGRRIRFWPGLAAAAFLAAGCAGSPASSSVVKLTGTEVTVLTGSVSPATSAQVDNAYQALVQHCMQSKGLPYYPAFVTAANVSRPLRLPGVPAAYISLSAREADGYGFYSQALQSGVSPGAGQGSGQQEEKYADSLTGATGQSYRLALDGSDSQRNNVKLPGGGAASIRTGGCLGAAERRLYGSVAGSIQATTGLSLLYDQLYTAVTSDPKFSAVVAKWSSCMTGRGFKYRAPLTLWDSLAGRIDRKPTPAAHELEIRTSVADYQCSATVKLVPTVQRLQAGHTQFMSRTFAQYLALVTRVEVNAAKVAKSLNPPG